MRKLLKIAEFFVMIIVAKRMEVTDMLTCKETKAVQSHIIMYPHLNAHRTLFGGQLMQWLDESGGISAVRLSRSGVVTASIDHLDFLHPLEHGHAVCIESYVSGVGHRSIEVFSKAIGENLITGERYLANTSFMTFVVKEKGLALPAIQPETEEEVYICSGYNERRAKRETQIKQSIDLAKNISLKLK